MHADFTLETDGSVSPTSKGSGRGGNRTGGGLRLPKSKDLLDLDKAKARKESADADLKELEYKVRLGLYLDRAAVVEAAATAHAMAAQSLRSLRDTLERQGVPVPICEQVDAAVTEALNTLAEDYRLMSGPEPDEG